MQIEGSQDAFPFTAAAIEHIADELSAEVVTGEPSPQQDAPESAAGSARSDAVAPSARSDAATSDAATSAAGRPGQEQPDANVARTQQLRLEERLQELQEAHAREKIALEAYAEAQDQKAADFWQAEEAHSAMQARESAACAQVREELRKEQQAYTHSQEEARTQAEALAISAGDTANAASASESATCAELRNELACQREQHAEHTQEAKQSRAAWEAEAIQAQANETALAALEERWRSEETAGNDAQLREHATLAKLRKDLENEHRVCKEHAEDHARSCSAWKAECDQLREESWEEGARAQNLTVAEGVPELKERLRMLEKASELAQKQESALKDELMHELSRKSQQHSDQSDVRAVIAELRDKYESEQRACTEQAEHHASSRNAWNEECDNLKEEWSAQTERLRADARARQLSDANGVAELEERRAKLENTNELAQAKAIVDLESKLEALQQISGAAELQESASRQLADELKNEKQAAAASAAKEARARAACNEELEQLRRLAD